MPPSLLSRENSWWIRRHNNKLKQASQLELWQPDWAQLSSAWRSTIRADTLVGHYTCCSQLCQRRSHLCQVFLGPTEHSRKQSHTLRNGPDTSGKERDSRQKAEVCQCVTYFQLCMVVNTFYSWESAVRVIGKEPARQIDDEELLLQQPR